MNNSTLISIVKSFSKEDIKSFDDFVKSPYFNKKSAVVKLWEAIYQKAPAFKEEELKRESLYCEIFPGKDFNYGTMKNIIYELTKLAEKFLELEFYKGDNYFNYYYELGGLLSKGQMKLYASRYDEIEKKLINAYEFDGVNYDQLFNLKWANLNYIFSNISKDESKNEVYMISKYLIYDFFVKLIKSYVNVKGIELEYNYKDDNSTIYNYLKHVDLEGFIKELKADSDKDQKILLVHYKLFRAVSTPEDSSFYFDLKESLQKYEEYFWEDEKRILYSGLRIALMYTAFYNDINYDGELLDIYKAMLNNNVILNYYGNIELIVFVNYICYASRAGDMDFLSTFLDNYLEKIPEEHRANLNLFGEANLHYIKNEFDKSLEALLKVDEKMIGIKRASKNLEMMIHYERSDYDSFQYTYDTYKHFVSRNKSIPENMKKGMLKTINYINLLFKLSEKPDKIEIEKFYNDVRKDNIAIKGWLMRKLKEF